MYTCWLHTYCNYENVHARPAPLQYCTVTQYYYTSMLSGVMGWTVSDSELYCSTVHSSVMQKGYTGKIRIFICNCTWLYRTVCTYCYLDKYCTVRTVYSVQYSKVQYNVVEKVFFRYSTASLYVQYRRSFCTVELFLEDFLDSNTNNNKAMAQLVAVCLLLILSVLNSVSSVSISEGVEKCHESCAKTYPLHTYPDVSQKINV